MTKALTGKRLEIAQKDVLQKLYEGIDNPSERFGFYSITDTQNYKDGTKHLAKAQLVDWETIGALSMKLLDQALHWRNHGGKHLPIGIDCETTGLSCYTNELIGIGLAVPKHHLASSQDFLRSITTKEVSCQTQQFDFYFLVAPEDERSYKGFVKKTQDMIKRLNPHVQWFMHNAKFDMLWVARKLGIMLRHIEDSMVMAYLLGERSIAIDRLAPKYLGRYPTTLSRMTGKDKKGLTPEVLRSIPIQEMADYCAEDCVEGVLLAKVLEEKLQDQICINVVDEESPYYSLHDVYEKYDLNCIHALVWAENHGVRIDWELLSSVGETLDSEMAAIEEDIAIILDLTLAESKRLVTRPFELSDLLFNTFELPTDGIKKGKKGFYSTNEEALKKLRTLHPLPSALLDHRKLKKLKGTYVEGLHKRQVDGIIHTIYENTRTDTGRLSSADPNLQNIPNPHKSSTGKLLRQCFIPREGKVLVKADYSQFELRILAHFSQDPYLIDCYQKGLDVHSLVTCLLFDVPYEKFDPDNNPQHKLWRTLVKNINFGLIYGMTSRKLFSMARSAGLNYTLEQCEELMARYWSRLPGVRDWMAVNRLFAIVYGYTETVFGRRRYFQFNHPYLKKLKNSNLELCYENWVALERKGVTNDWKDQESFRAIGNAPIQGSNADCIRRAMGLCYGEWFDTETFLLLNVHDEIVLETPIGTHEEVAYKLKYFMEYVASGLRVPIKADPVTSINWGNC